MDAPLSIDNVIYGAQRCRELSEATGFHRGCYVHTVRLLKQSDQSTKQEFSAAHLLKYCQAIQVQAPYAF